MVTKKPKGLGRGLEALLGPTASEPSNAESDANPADLSVVTSDGDLARRVRDAGATVLGAGEFRRRLDG